MKHTKEQIEKAKLLCKKLSKINKEIIEAGFYGVYLANDTANIMIGPHHDDNNNCKELDENVVASVRLSGWDGGDW